MHADYTLKRLVQVRFVCLGWFSSGGRDGGVQGGGGRMVAGLVQQ